MTRLRGLNFAARVCVVLMLTGCASEPSPGRQVFPGLEDDATPDLGPLDVWVVDEADAGQTWEVPECPVAEISVAEGGTVSPRTVLHLSGTLDGYSHFAREWRWSYYHPADQSARFYPSDSVSDPLFAVEAAGLYRFYLTASDVLGVHCCEPAIADVVVIPEAPIRIELFWYTYGDPDETDWGVDAGTNMDLHLVHPLADGPDLLGDGEPDGYFDPIYDCWSGNPHPGWGPWGPAGDPAVRRWDSDGGGPEVITVEDPEATTYRFAVHHANSNGYGPAYFTLALYLQGEPVYELSGYSLSPCGLAHVGTIEWPSGKVSTFDPEFTWANQYSSPCQEHECYWDWNI